MEGQDKKKKTKTKQEKPKAHAVGWFLISPSYHLRAPGWDHLGEGEGEAEGSEMSLSAG